MWTPEKADEPPKTKTPKRDTKPAPRKCRKLAKKVAEISSAIPDDSFSSILLNHIKKSKK